MRRPTDRLHSRCVLVELHDWLVRMKVPDHQFVVVSTRGQLLVVKAPLQTAHLLLMARKFAEMRPGCPQVSLQDIMVAAACAHNRLVPRNGADASLVPLKVPN